ncbi:hypothetical protein [Paenibacillus sp. BC26]|uniref:hypothetical protein n=1 Tax=Paenibacillus sp. BC26 TaxID=1881032 RepID=UPI0008DF86A3|nr:hypothetical protein [Paenibacillus sp. BC26]SFS76023.1 hypothetical protein SAMN05428962_2692 [Paenibacillus sp. BC26]
MRVLRLLLKNQFLLSSLVGAIISAISFLFSFILGVFLVEQTFTGNAYYGAIIYFPYFAAIFSILIPFFITDKIFPSLKSNLRIVGYSLISGFIFFITSVFINNEYIGNVERFPDLSGGLAIPMIGYNISFEFLLLDGLILVSSIFLLLKYKRKGRNKASANGQDSSINT